MTDASGKQSSCFQPMEDTPSVALYNPPDEVYQDQVQEKAGRHPALRGTRLSTRTAGWAARPTIAADQPPHRIIARPVPFSEAAARPRREQGLRRPHGSGAHPLLGKRGHEGAAAAPIRHPAAKAKIVSPDCRSGQSAGSQQCCVLASASPCAYLSETWSLWIR